MHTFFHIHLQISFKNSAPYFNGLYICKILEVLANVQLALAICNEKLLCYSTRMVPVASYCF
jgi:hypothetical protein